MIAREIGRDLRFFAYPSGSYDARTMAAAAAAGYHGSFRKDGGSVQSLTYAQALRRTRVVGPGSVQALAQASKR